MDTDNAKRLGGIAGGCIFILVLVGLLGRLRPESALLAALAAGIFTGLAVWAGGVLTVLMTPPPPAPPEVKEEEDMEKTRELPADGREVAPTVELSPEDLRKAIGSKTVRLGKEAAEKAALDMVLPDVAPEEVLREREGLDMSVLAAIEGSAAVSENTVEDKGA